MDGALCQGVHEAILTTCFREQAEVLLRLETGAHHGAVPDLRFRARGVFRPGRSGRACSRGPAPAAGAFRRDGDRPRTEWKRTAGADPEPREAEVGSSAQVA